MQNSPSIPATAASAAAADAAAEADDGGFASNSRYNNGRHQRQMQQRTARQQQLMQQLSQQRASYADPMKDGTLRGYTNPDYFTSTDDIHESESSEQTQQAQQSQTNGQRLQDLPVYTVSTGTVAFNAGAPAPGGESSTDWPDSAWQQPAQSKQSGKCPIDLGRYRLVAGAAVVFLAAVVIVLVIALPVALVANRSRDTPGPSQPKRQEATGNQREINCGLLTATGASAAGSTTVYRFAGIPYALSPNGSRLMSWARPIDNQQACAIAWGLSSQDLPINYYVRPLRYPYSSGSIPMCLQYTAMGASSDTASSLTGSPDCLYLDVATPAAEPDRGLPTVLLMASLVGIHTPTNLLLDFPDDLVTSTNTVYFSMRHRVGPLGFFTHPDLSDESPRRVAGNMPISDMVAALRWLKINTRSFGGSPTNVVLAGHGTSGALALSITLSGEYNSLFHKLWITSPPLTIEQSLAKAEQMDAASIPCLKANCRAALNVNSFVSSVEWARLTNSIQTDFYDIPALAPSSGLANTKRGFSVIDGVHVRNGPINLAAKLPMTKPLVLGSMLEDSASFFIDPATNQWTDAYLAQYIDYRLSAAGVNATGQGQQVVKFYRSLAYWNDTSPTVSQRYAQVVTDLRLTCTLNEFARRLAVTSDGGSSPAFYRYLMTARPRQPSTPYAWSKSTVTAAFGGFDRLLLFGGSSVSGGVAYAEDVAAWRSIFAEFVRTGQIASWSQYDYDTRLVNRVPESPGNTVPVFDPRADLCKMWAAKFPNLLYRGWYA